MTFLSQTAMFAQIVDGRLSLPIQKTSIFLTYLTEKFFQMLPKTFLPFRTNPKMPIVSAEDLVLQLTLICVTILQPNTVKVQFLFGYA